MVKCCRLPGCYTHRVAIANERLVSIDDGVVRFRWKDYGHHDQVNAMALPAEEFLRRFLLHVVAVAKRKEVTDEDSTRGTRA